jgi:hypothetical protein
MMIVTNPNSLYTTSPSKEPIISLREIYKEF